VNDRPRVEAWTDGACSGNPGPGGYGVVLVRDGERQELAAGFRKTTNNRMEIRAVMAALEALDGPSRVTIHSDSQYVVNAIEQGWARKWQANRWMRNKKERALNPDLWAKLLALLARHQVKMVWVRGHDGNEENERADRLAVAALRGPELVADTGYDG
jgi:ribonuclease HI